MLCSEKDSIIKVPHVYDIQVEVLSVKCGWLIAHVARLLLLASMRTRRPIVLQVVRLLYLLLVNIVLHTNHCN